MKAFSIIVAAAGAVSAFALYGLRGIFICLAFVTLAYLVHRLQGRSRDTVKESGEVARARTPRFLRNRWIPIWANDPHNHPTAEAIARLREDSPAQH